MPSPRAQRFTLYRRTRRRLYAPPFWFRVQFCAIWLPFLLLAANRAAAGEPPSAAIETRRLQGLVDELRARLAVPQDISVAVVSKNPLMASVETVKGRPDWFLLSVEQGFLEGLSDDELRAVIAHELGHVWIFTHHPYLQTERLANQIAMRLVTRDSLERVYGKLWQHNGSKGDLARFLGEPVPSRVIEAARGAASPH